MLAFAFGFWIGAALAGYVAFQYGRRPDWTKAKMFSLLDKVTGK